jgi:hypothetical protein
MRPLWRRGHLQDYDLRGANDSICLFKVQQEPEGARVNGGTRICSIVGLITVAKGGRKRGVGVVTSGIRTNGLQRTFVLSQEQPVRH